MMDATEVEKYVNEMVELIAINAAALAQAPVRTANFLTAQAVLANFKREIEIELPKLETLTTAQYNKAYQASKASSVTEKKSDAESSAEYASAVEALGSLKALREWTKTHMEIFENAHLMYRQFSRE